MQVYLLEQREEDVPDSNNWLGKCEREHVRTLTFLKRRTDWRLGRWSAKCAIAALQNIPPHPDLLASIEIRAAASGVPEVFLEDLPADLTVSISHRSGVGICALSDRRVRLGCDLEVVEPHSAGFVADYFAAEEQELAEKVASVDRWRLVALLWSAKESALKVLQEGLRRDTRSVIVKPGSLGFGEGWNSLQVHSMEGDDFHGWWREAKGRVQTVLADRFFAAPVCLESPIFNQAISSNDAAA
jgi:4'-phosphopantetheinyl transferase